MRAMKRALEMKICEWCQREFLPNRRWQRFCTNACRVEQWFSTHPRVALDKIKEEYREHV